MNNPLVPVQSEYFLHAENGIIRTRTLCTAACRAAELFINDIIRFDPFQTGFDIFEEKDSFYWQESFTCH